MSLSARERILVALDTSDTEQARRLVGRLAGKVGGFKIGLELFSVAGPDFVREVRDAGNRLFLDLKLHDIPNTVARASSAIGRLGVAFFTLHGTGGPRMLRAGSEAAAEAADGEGLPRPTALAVTVLTSHDDAELTRVGLAGPCAAAVVRLARLAVEAEVGGLVCSPLEISAVRNEMPRGVLVVPGIRPATGTVAGDDQNRVATPASAVATGADRLVIGRPITRSADPVRAVERIVAELDGAS